MLKIHLRVKFRAFFITFYTLDEMFPVALPIAINLPPQAERQIFNERGVYLGVLID